MKLKHYNSIDDNAEARAVLRLAVLTGRRWRLEHGLAGHQPHACLPPLLPLRRVLVLFLLVVTVAVAVLVVTVAVAVVPVSVVARAAAAVA